MISVTASAVGLVIVGAYAGPSPSGPGPAWSVLTPLPSTLVPPPPVGGCEGTSVASVGNEIIVALGHEPMMGDTATTRIYDVALDSWSFGAPAPGPSAEGAGIAHGGLFYNVGGRGPASQAMWSYDPSGDFWTMLAPMPTGRSGLAVATVGNAIFAIGGRTGTGGPNSFGKLAVVERYDIDADTWTTVAPLPTARSGMGAATVGGKIFVFGGFDAAGNVLADVDMYDPPTDTWTTAPADLPTARGALYTVATKGCKVFVIGGWDGMMPFNTAVGSVVEAYDAAKDTWTLGYPPMPTPCAESGATSHGGRIYIMGGAQPGFGASIDNCQSFKP